MVRRGGSDESGRETNRDRYGGIRACPVALQPWKGESDSPVNLAAL